MRSSVSHDNRNQKPDRKQAWTLSWKKAHKPFNPSTIHVVSKRKWIKNVHKIILPQSDLIYSLSNSLIFIPISVKAEVFYCQVEADIVLYQQSPFVEPCYPQVIQIYHWFQSIVRVLSICLHLPTVDYNKQQQEVINITSSLSTTCNILFNTKRNASIWQTWSFQPFTVFNGSEISYSFPSVSIMPQSWKQACTQFHAKHH